MKKILFSCYVLLYFGFNIGAFGQHTPWVNNSENKEIRKIAKRIENNGWIWFSDSINIKPADVFTNYKAYFGLETNDQMVPLDVKQDSLNESHYRYHQYHKGLWVEGGEYTIHVSKSKVTHAHGKIVENLLSSSNPSISEEQALQAVLKEIKVRKYAWEIPQWEQQKRIDSKDSSATWYPKGKLLFARIDRAKDMAQDKFRLAYRFYFKTTNPKNDLIVFVDANTGRLLKQQTSYCEYESSFESLYNGGQIMTTKDRGWPNNDYSLEAVDQKIQTKYYQDKAWWLTSNISRCCYAWGTWDQAATSAHWAGIRSFNYYKSLFGRNGAGNNGRDIRIHSNYPQANALYYDDGCDNIVIGTWTNGRSLATLDVVGHEYTHGITRAVSQLAYQGEPGALNESFSDIFGTMVERSVVGANAFNWLVGSDAFTLRSMSNPNSIPQGILSAGQPDFYLQQGFWYTGAEDNGGVHINSGVQNYWYFLLCQGGRGRNGQLVNGIGPDRAATIAYRNLNLYIQQLSNHADARNGAIQAATDLFGACSRETIETTNAWAAVGVGVPAAFCASNISGSNIICNVDRTSSNVFSIITTTGSQVTWRFPTGWAFTIGANGLTANVTSIPLNGSGTVTSTITNAGQVLTRSLAVTVKTCTVPSDPKPCPTCPQRIGIQEESLDKNSSVELYPNPVQEELTVNLPYSQKPTNIKVIDLQGHTLRTYQTTKSSFSFNTQTLKPGLYLLLIHNDQGVISKKFQTIR